MSRPKIEARFETYSDGSPTARTQQMIRGMEQMAIAGLRERYYPFGDRTKSGIPAQGTISNFREPQRIFGQPETMAESIQAEIDYHTRPTG